MLAITFAMTAAVVIAILLKIASEIETERGFRNWWPTILRRLALIVFIIGVIAVRSLYFDF